MLLQANYLTLIVLDKLFQLYVSFILIFGSSGCSIWILTRFFFFLNFKLCQDIDILIRLSFRLNKKMRVSLFCWICFSSVGLLHLQNLMMICSVYFVKEPVFSFEIEIGLILLNISQEDIGHISYTHVKLLCNFFFRFACVVFFQEIRIVCFPQSSSFFP